MKRDMIVKTIATALTSVMVVNTAVMPVSAVEADEDVFASAEDGSGEESVPYDHPMPTGYVPKEEDFNVAWLDDSYTPEMIDAMLEDKIPDASPEADGEEADVFDQMPTAPTVQNPLPSAYPFTESDDLYDYIGANDSYQGKRLPAQRNQNPVGDCWAHSAMALMEIYKDSESGNIDNTRDLSEAHLVHYTYTTGDNPNTATAEDTIQIKRGNTDAAEHVKYLIGGDLGDAAATLMHWKGAVNDDGTYAPTHGFTGNTKYLHMKNANTVLDAATQWNEEGNQSGHNERILKEYYTINIKQNPAYVKHWIREHGAVGIAYCHDANYYTSRSGIDSYYYPSAVDANHAVTVVGWDDNYSRDNFDVNNDITPRKVKPTSNGAWLVRNSWSTDVGEIKDFYSYFWLSYEDKGLADAAYAFVAEDTDTFRRYDYYYDLQYCSRASETFGSSYDYLSANVFTNQSGSDEILDSVNFYYRYADDGSNLNSPQHAKVYVYTDLSNYYPDSGNKIFVGEQDIPFTGRYSLNLNDEVVIRAGSRFSVVVQTHDMGVSFECSDTMYYLQIEDVNENANNSFTYTDYQAVSTVGSSSGQSIYNNLAAGGSIDDAISINWVDRSNRDDYPGNFIIGACTTNYEDAHNNDLAIATITLSSPSAETIVYNGVAWEPEFQVKIGNTVLANETDYTVRYEDNVVAGTGKAVFTGTGAYTGTQTVEFTIAKCPMDAESISVTCDYPDGKDYFELDPRTGKAEPEVTVKHTINGVPQTLTKGTHYSVSYENNDKGGNMTITVTGTGDNYCDTKQLTKKVRGPLPDDITLYAPPAEYIVYCGQAWEPDFTVMDGETELTRSVDYTVAYENNVEAGTAKAVFTGIGTYIGERTVEFTINKCPIDNAWISCDYPEDKEYFEVDPATGRAEPEVTVKEWINGEYQPLQKGTDYTVSYKNNDKTGVMTITVTGTGKNYCGTYDIEKRVRGFIPAGITVSYLKKRVIYNGQVQQPEFDVLQNGNILQKGAKPEGQYTVSQNTRIEAGDSSVKVTFDSDEPANPLWGSFDVPFTIEQKDIGSKDIEATLSQTEFTADGTEKKPGVTVTATFLTDPAKQVLTEGTDYTVEYMYNVEPGTAKCFVTGKGNYTGSRFLEFEIDGIDINSEDITIGVQDGLVYDGTAKKPKVSVTRNGAALKEDEDYTVDYGSYTDAGEAKVTVTGKREYFGTRSQAYTIAPADISGEGYTLSVSDEKLVADGTEKKPNVTLLHGTKALKPDKDYTVAYKNNILEGTAGVTVTGKGNYKGSRSASFVIEKGEMSEVVCEPVSVTVGDVTADVTVSVDYKNTIEYTGSKITPATLGIQVDKTGLEELAKQAATKSGDVTKLFKVGYSKLKNNTNAGEVTFTTKITFNEKKAKKMGISADDRKALKEAVKALNAELANKKQTFTITKVNLADHAVKVSASFKKGKLKFSSFKVKIGKKYKKLKKNKDYKIVSNDAENNTVTITGWGKNYEGVIMINLTTKEITVL